jgi:hypothetical protein
VGKNCFLKRREDLRFEESECFYDYIVRSLYFAAYSVIRMHTLAEKGGINDEVKEDWVGIMS